MIIFKIIDIIRYCGWDGGIDTKGRKIMDKKKSSVASGVISKGG